MYESQEEGGSHDLYLCHRLNLAAALCFKPRDGKSRPRFFINMVYGQPEKKSTPPPGAEGQRNINGRKWFTSYVLITSAVCRPAGRISQEPPVSVEGREAFPAGSVCFHPYLFIVPTSGQRLQ